MARTSDDLKQMQALPLSLKVSLTKSRIRQWVNEFGENGVYVSFSGGKDSTVLLHIVRELYPNVPAVFVNTGLEFPEIVKFVKTFDNVEIVNPKMNFKKVIEKYGYPFISKEISQRVYEAQKGEKAAIEKLEGARKSGMFDISKYKFFLSDDAPRLSHMCCFVMKKTPAKQYEKCTGRKPILATMTEESALRRQRWLKTGCNAFNQKRPISAPMSFWTEQDVLQYIKENGLKIATVYGDIVTDEVKSENIEGQLRLNLDGTIGETECMLKTTGMKRTGCMFCGFGCHSNGDKRFLVIKQLQPKIYEWIMKPWDDGGLGYKDVIAWINEHGNLNIKY